MSQAVSPQAGLSEISIPTTAAGEACGAVALENLQQISRLLTTLVACWDDPLSVRHQRGRQRMPFEKLLALTPVDEETEQPVAQPMGVRSRDISPDGVSFVHRSPLPFRKVTLTFAAGTSEVTSIVTRLIWCRFTRDGRYQSGGKFLRAVESPITDAVDWRLLPTA